MSGLSLNAGLEIDGQDVPSNDKIVDLVDTQKEEVQGKREVVVITQGDPIVGMGEDVFRSFESIEALLDIRHRLKDIGRINRSYAHETLEVQPDLPLPKLNRYTEEFTKTNYKTSMEAIEERALSLLQLVVVEKLPEYAEQVSEQTNRVLVKTEVGLSVQVEQIRSNIAMAIQQKGLSGLGSYPFSPEDLMVLEQLAKASPAVALFLNEPKQIDLFIQQGRQVGLLRGSVSDYGYQLTQLKNALINNDENGIATACKEMLDINNEFEAALASFGEINNAPEVVSINNGIYCLYQHLRSCIRADGTDGVNDLLAIVEATTSTDDVAISYTFEDIVKVIDDIKGRVQSEDVDQMVAVSGCLAQGVGLQESLNDCIGKTNAVCSQVINLLHTWSAILAGNQ